jgi:hypothetical protein
LMGDWWELVDIGDGDQVVVVDSWVG